MRLVSRTDDCDPLVCIEGKVIAHCIDGNHSTRPGDEVRTIVSWWCVRHQRVVTWVYEGPLHPFPTPIRDEEQT